VTGPRDAGRPVTAAEYAAVEAQLAGVLGTGRDVLMLQGEAILGLEAAARGISGPGQRVLNIVTGPYGAMVGRWLAGSGAAVTELSAPEGRAATAAAVQAALHDGPGYDTVAVVHAEAATGVLNPLPEIAALTRAAGALLMVDAVASVGAEPLLIDEWDLDVVIVGPQKALAGPAGVSGAVLSPRAWAALAANPAAPRDSILSLLDHRDQWLGSGRSQLTLTPHHLETRALAAALDRLAAGGLGQVVARHRLARDAGRAGLRALGLEPHVAADVEAASVATVVTTGEGTDPAVLLAAAAAVAARPAGPAAAGAGLPPGGDLIIGPGFGPLAGRTLRLNHTGDGAALGPVLTSLACLGAALDDAGRPADIPAALGAATAAWRRDPPPAAAAGRA
jgi:aspartate aminotransferase-like enzyme